MRLDSELMEGLKQLKAVSGQVAAWTDFEIFDPEHLECEQIGYAIDPEGRSLVTREDGSWQADWLVIGNMEPTGDPIIVETGEPEQPVAVLMHGMGDWNAGSYLAGSVIRFKEAAEQIMQFISRENEGTSLRITCAELDQAVAAVAAADEYADIDIWKSLLAPAYQAAVEREADLIGQVLAMSK
ncbi:hypothetical protein [Paenibacillus sp.]|jgi:hypothetical protein|uniref:hypothetical protein n=1 Tax=Paenibacillus sp. TaxID=58172 RepID=UPI002832946C|nr:hypothetical protein [Paenibacillus sp.]MDR0271415.1 hypothetical protein [Paenibacillus sp.]